MKGSICPCRCLGPGGGARDARGRQLRERWSGVLGNVEPSGIPKEAVPPQEVQFGGGAKAYRLALETEPGI